MTFERVATGTVPVVTSGKYMAEKYFEKALADFAVDFASGGAIRVLADKGYTVRQIKERLDFPLSMEKVRELVWKHYVDSRVILLEEPDNAPLHERVKYEKVQDSYGHTSFIQVIITENSNQNDKIREYVACDFGKRMYQDRNAFEESLKALSDDDRDYILGLPWPLQTVWHVRNERMARIEKVTRGQNENVTRGTVPVVTYEAN